MKYIVHKRFKGLAICGEVNLPVLTECEEADGIICCNGNPVCAVTSENAHQHFAVNDDGQGMTRGELTRTIQKTLAKRNGKCQERWNRVWESAVCQKYKRTEYADYWLWNHDFFNAPIEELQKIKNIIEGR